MLSKFIALFLRPISVQSSCFQVVQTVHIGHENVGRHWPFCGPMAMSVTPENISRVEFLIRKDPKITCSEIQDIMKISLGSFTCILSDCLEVWKCCAHWVPHNQKEEQKRVG